MHEEYLRTYCTSDGNWLVGEPAPSSVGDVICLTFLPETGKVEARMLNGARFALAKWRSDSILGAKEAAHIATLLCQRGVNHPADHGFVWGDTRPKSNTCDGLPVPPGMPEPQAGFGKETCTDGGWFPPNADPTRFGVLYVGRSATPWPNIETTWHLRQVGLPDVVDSARWDDAEGCARLRESARDDVLREALLVQDVLVRDQQEFARYRTLAVKRRATLAAREAFARPRDRIKPVLVEGCVERANVAVRERMVGVGVAPPVWLKPVSLDDLSVAQGLSPINIALTSKTFPSLRAVGWSPEALAGVVDEWAGVVQANLDERRLGSLFRFRRGQGFRFVVAKSPELVFRFAAAAGIPDGSLMERFGSDADGGVRWERFCTVTHVDGGEV